MASPSSTVLQSRPSAADATFQEYVLTRRRIFILPSRHGVSFCLVAAVMLIGAINYNNSLGYMLTFALVSLALVSMLHAYRNLAGLRLRLAAGTPVFAGERMCFGLLVDNRQQPMRYDIDVSVPEPKLQSKPGRTVTHTSILADSTLRVDLDCPTFERGWLNTGRLIVSTRFPFGLFRAWAYYRSETQSLVYPRPGGSTPLPQSNFAALEAAGLRDLGHDDFAGLRNYVPGDSSRKIHWKTVARMEILAVKVFSGTQPAEVHLSWNDTIGDDVEKRLSQLCLWVLTADQQDVLYALDLPGLALGPAAGEGHRRACLRALALYGA